MSIVYVVEQGAKLSIEQRRLLITKSQDLITKAPLVQVRTVILFGNITITTPAMKTLMDAGIDVVFLSYYGNYQGRLIGADTRFGELRQFQYERVSHEHVLLPLGQTIVSNKIANMRTWLQRLARQSRIYTPQDHFEGLLNDLNTLQHRALRTTRLNSLLGVEGRASALYFQAWRHFLKHDWGFDARHRRPPTDPVNVLLSFGYTLLTRALESWVLTVGLDPYLGVLHRVSYGRPSLALDLVEEFRATIVDSVVLKVLNNEIIRPTDFYTPPPDERNPYPIVLSEDGRKRFLQAYEERINTTVKHPLTQQTLTYRQIFELQTRLMARAFRENRPYVPFQIK